MGFWRWEKPISTNRVTGRFLLLSQEKRKPMPIAPGSSPRTATAPTTLETAAKDYRDLVTAISTKRHIISGSQHGSILFQVVGGRVLKSAMLATFGDVAYRFSDNYVEQTAPSITLHMDLATEEDLLNARAMAPAQAGSIDILLRTLREGEQPEKPLKIEITNIDALKSPKIIQISRDDSGKMQSATVLDAQG
jgi:hypothetical protein